MYNFIKNTKFNKPNNFNRGTIPPPFHGAKTVSLFSQPYLDLYNQCYKNIVVVNFKPQGPLGEFVKLVKFPPLSEFKYPAPCSPIKDCGYAIMSLNGCDYNCGKFGSNLMVVDEVPDLISYLVPASKACCWHLE
jgi:hypothetical protein